MTAAVLAAGAGLGLWITGLWLLGSRAIGADDTLHPGPARAAGVCILLGILAWAIGLRLA